MRQVDDWIADSRNAMPADSYRISTIISEVNKLPMKDVLMHYGVKFTRSTGNRLLAMCPFHTAQRVGSFSVTVSKNLCWCFACNQGGSNVMSYQAMYDVDEKTAGLQIACDFELITKEEFEELSEAEYVKIESKYQGDKDLRPKPVYDKKTLEIRTATYEFMRDYFGLTDEHRKYLSEVRHLEQDRINSDYFSIDTKSNPKKIEEFIAAYKAEFPQYASEMTTIPGFFEHKEWQSPIWKPTLMLFDGIGILMRDINKKVPAIQVRMTNTDINGIRYKFMSREFGNDNDTNNRGGGNSGTPIDVVFPKRVTKDTMVCLTEGRFKTEILRQQGCIGVSIQGVNNFYGIELTLNAIEKKIGRPIGTLYTFFDADLVENIQVFKALASLYDYLQEEKPELKLYQLVWREEFGKGIDDCILAGNRSMMRPVAMSEMKTLYEKSLEEALFVTGLKDVKPVKMTRNDRVRLNSTFKTIVCAELFH